MDEMAKVMGNSSSINGDLMSASPDLSVNMIRQRKEMAQYILGSNGRDLFISNLHNFYFQLPDWFG